MKLMSIASGSSGNCIMVGSDHTTLLVDVGISKKRIVEGLKTGDIDISNVDGILITHEHIDHVKALGVISRSYEIPIYATDATCHQLTYMKQLGDFDYDLFTGINPDQEFIIGDIHINAHSIWHDAIDPVCYTFECNNKKISIATDMGNYDEYIINSLQNSDALVIEANHDIKMLEVGPYPYELKRRILSNRGHLSNEASGKLIKSLLNNHIKCIMLGHLSDKNNYPELAYMTVRNELLGNGLSDDMDDFGLMVAKRDCPSKMYNI